MVKVKIKNRKPTTIAYIEHMGKYDEVPYGEYMEKLYMWAKQKKLKPGFKPLSIFHDDPENVPSAQLRSEIGLPIMVKGEPEDNIKVKEIAQMQVAAIKHKGPSEDYPKSYSALSDWISTNGYEVAGPFMEIYTKKPKKVGDKQILFSEIQAPIKKKA